MAWEWNSISIAFSFFWLSLFVMETFSALLLSVQELVFISSLDF